MFISIIEEYISEVGVKRSSVATRAVRK